MTNDKPSHTVRKVASGVISVLIAVAIFTAVTNKTTVTTVATAKAATATTTPAPQPTAKVGDTIAIGGSNGLSVTLLQVMDPAQSTSQYITPDPGKRFVAVDVRITNNGSAAVSDDANNNLSIVGSDNQTYTFSPYPVLGCTNFHSGIYTLAPGESSTGCTVFQLPSSVNATKVEFQTMSGLSGNAGEWTAQ
jgi:hypothetical protein